MELKLSLQELKSIVAEKYNISSEFELTIEDCIKNVSTNKGKDGWIEVPTGWTNTYCPDKDLPMTTTVEYVLRCGNSYKNCLDYLGIEWVQEGHDHDIIKYRVVSK